MDSEMKARNSMRKKWVTILCLVALFVFTSTMAFAGMGIRSLTFSGGLSSSASAGTFSASTTTLATADSVACKGNAVQLAICFTLSGVGKQPVDVTATVTGLVSTVCTNKGGTAAPGRNLVLTTVSTTGAFQSDKNGNVTGVLITPVPGQVSARDAGCPANNWTATAVAVDFQTLHFVVTQNGATPIDLTFDNLPNN